jgi:hypothetical protein
MSQNPTYLPDDGDWVCERCGLPLEARKVQARYLDSAFDLTLAVCPKCGQYIVPKGLAEGKMLEVERILEDK